MRGVMRSAMCVRRIAQKGSSMKEIVSRVTDDKTGFYCRLLGLEAKLSAISNHHHHKPQRTTYSSLLHLHGTVGVQPLR
jgi:hypothetical protein